jgi:hypothetical protein
MRRPLIPLLALALLLAGCTAGSGAADSAGAQSGASIVSEDAGADSSGSESAGGAPDVGVVADVDDVGRQVVTEGSVTVTVESPRSAAQDAAALVEQSGGHVQERVEAAGQGSEEDTARLVVRVPADRLTGVLQELEKLGRVDGVELTSDDVTGQAQDLDARIRALQISVTRLEDLLTRAQTTADVVSAEQTLTERQSQLEQLQSERARLADRVDLSTVSLLFRTDGAAPPPVRAGFGGGLATGWESLLTALSAGLTVLGVLLPWSVAGGAVAVAVLTVRRELRRRRPVLPTGPTGPAADPSAS